MALPPEAEPAYSNRARRNGDLREAPRLTENDVFRRHRCAPPAETDVLLRRVLAIDPRYVPAWNALASNFINGAISGMLRAEEGFGKARDAARKALEIDPEYAPAHSSLAWVALLLDDGLAKFSAGWTRRSR